jgi:hypothetical protein
MNVALLDPTPSSCRTREVSIDPGFAGAAEWIDPEGDDWFAAIYRELTAEAGPIEAAPSSRQPELEHWFG